jgi:hypothetical protein
MRVGYAQLNWVDQEAVNQSLFGVYGSESVVSLLVNNKSVMLVLLRSGRSSKEKLNRSRITDKNEIG